MAKKPAKQPLTSEQIHAMRMAKLDQGEAMSKRYGLRTMLMHYSALSPTTRKSHAERHGKLFTPDEIRAWYEQEGNDEGCRCSFIEVQIDDHGEPLVPAIVERAHQTFEKMKAKGKGDWTKG